MNNKQEEGDNVDYTSYFTNEVYDTAEEAFAAAQQIAFSLGFFLRIGSVKRNESEICQRKYLECIHGFPRKTSSVQDPDNARRTNSRSGKLGCPFWLSLKVDYFDGVLKWHINPVSNGKEPGKSRGFHSHKLELYSEGSTQRNSFSSSEKADIKEMEATQVQPQQMKRFLNKKYGAKHGIKQFYNETAEIRRERLGGMGVMRMTLQQA